MIGKAANGADRWIEEQLFEEDLRSVLMMLRPNRRERLEGWNEYRTGGAEFRITVSWSSDFEAPAEMQVWRVPRMAQVLETLLVGAVRNQDELTPQEEFEFYRQVTQDLRQRIDEMESCYT